MSDLSGLYQQIILNHNKNPRNFHRPEGANRKAEGYNPVCGDQIQVYANLENDHIVDIGFEGSGCAIATASASLMTENVKGKTRAEAIVLMTRVKAMLTEPGAPSVPLGDLEALAGVRQFPVRIQCAMLPWKTLLAALDE